jgi:hypothetical protein
MNQAIGTIGILGAGKLGITLAQLAAKAGYAVYIAGSGSPKRIALTIEVLAPGVIAATSHDAIERSDIIILALPLGKFRTLTPKLFSDKLVIDAMNHWWEVDGPREDTIPYSQSSSEAVRAFLHPAHVVKALSHMSYHDLHDEAKPHGAQHRKAIAIAGDTVNDIAIVSLFIDILGFDPLPVGMLSEGKKLEPGSAAFGAAVSKKQLQQLLVKTL